MTYVKVSHLYLVYRPPCVNLFIGFYLCHVPPQAVLVILSEREFFSCQLGDASTFMSCTTTASSLQLSYGWKVTLPLEDDDVLELPMVDLLNLPAIHPPLEKESASLGTVNLLGDILQSSSDTYPKP